MRRPAAWVVLLSLAAVSPAAGQAAPSAAQGSAPFDPLLDQWRAAPAAERGPASSELRAFIRELLGADAIDAYRTYLLAEPGSAEEQAALEKAQAVAEAAAPDVRWERVQEMLDGYFAANDAFRDTLRAQPWQAAAPAETPKERSLLEVAFGRDEDLRLGPAEPLEVSEVELRLIPTSGRATAGLVWAVQGVVKNLSDRPIWIVDRYASLSLPPEVWGTGQVNKPIYGAFHGDRLLFQPATPMAVAAAAQQPTHRVIRIPPGTQQGITWRVDTCYPESFTDAFQEAAGFQKVGQWLRRVTHPMIDFWDFRPGTYTLVANLRVWTHEPPMMNAAGVVVNTGWSFPVVAEQPIEVTASLWILILGAVFGGTIAYYLVLLYQRQEDAPRPGEQKKDLAHLMDWSVFQQYRMANKFRVVRGWAISTLLCMIAVIMIARLANSDFIVSVQVQDFWSAVAAGFIIQLLGVTYFIEKLRHYIGADRAAQEGKQEAAQEDDELRTEAGEPVADQADVVPLAPEEAGGDGDARGDANEVVRPAPTERILESLAAAGDEHSESTPTDATLDEPLEPDGARDALP